MCVYMAVIRKSLQFAKKELSYTFCFLSRQNDDDNREVVNGKNVCYFIWLFHDRNLKWLVIVNLTDAAHKQLYSYITNNIIYFRATSGV